MSKSRSTARRSSVSSRRWNVVMSSERRSSMRPAAPPTYTRCSPSSTSSVNAGSMTARNSRSLAGRDGSSKRLRRRRAPRFNPATCSFRYSRAQSASPGSTGPPNTKSRFVTPPVEVMMTTTTTCGCSTSTSTWRTTVVSSDGAVASASRWVTCVSAAIVVSRAASTSLRTPDRSSARSVGFGARDSSRRST